MKHIFIAIILILTLSTASFAFMDKNFIILNQQSTNTTQFHTTVSIDPQTKTFTAVAPNTADITLNYGVGDYFATGDTHNYRVYSYVNLPNGTKVFSPTYADTDFVTDDGSESHVRWCVNWDRVDNVDGYRIVAGIGSAEYYWDHYRDVVQDDFPVDCKLVDDRASDWNICSPLIYNPASGNNECAFPLTNETADVPALISNGLNKLGIVSVDSILFTDGSSMTTASVASFLYSSFFDQFLNTTSDVTFHKATVNNLSFADGTSMTTAPTSAAPLNYSSYFDQPLNTTSNVTFANIARKIYSYDAVNLTASLTNINLFTPTITGMYRVSAVFQITRAASTSSTFGSGPSPQFFYREPDGHNIQNPKLVMATQAGIVLSALANTGNTIQTQNQGTGILYIEAGSPVNMTYTMAQTGSPPLLYSAHVRFELVG